VWVVWALATLYGSPLGEHLVFKGGTSLSKAYGVILRFSEDVDLTYDIRALAPDLVGDNGDALPNTRSEEKRWKSEVRKRLPEWVAGAVQPIIAEALARETLSATIRIEGDKLFIDYEATTAGSGYVAPSVMLEFGARSTGEPASAVARHKAMFFAERAAERSPIDYAAAVDGGLQLVPADDGAKALEEDYARMAGESGEGLSCDEACKEIVVPCGGHSL
jgi:hypothetical protein